MFASTLTLCSVLLVAAVSAAPLKTRAGTTLSNGKGMQSGKISNSLSWQSSGKLIRGGCPGSVNIGDCYQVLLGASGNLARRDDAQSDVYYTSESTFPAFYDSSQIEFEESEDALALQTRGGSARQRIELYSQPMAASGSQWTYKWKSWIAPETKTTGTFFHLFQVLSRTNGGGPILTLDAKGGKAMIIDSPRGCNGCKSIPFNQFAGRTIQHSLTIKFGSSGTLSYTASAGGKTLIAYNSKGNMGSDASLKSGAYRGVTGDMGPVTSYVGDFQFSKR